MSRLRMAASAACCFVALFSGQALASEDAQCWQAYEVDAARVRDLHIMLMLGTLKCKSSHPEIADKYEAFVEKKNAKLMSYNNILKARFMRVNGIADGQRAYEAFNTRLGNSHSSDAQPGNICEITDTLLGLANDASDKELPLLAQSFSDSRLGIGARCNEAAMDAKASPPATVSVATAETPKTEPQSAAEALEAAAAALQTAAASLKTQPAQPAETAAAKPVTVKSAEPATVKPAVVETAAEPAG